MTLWRKLILIGISLGLAACSSPHSPHRPHETTAIPDPVHKVGNPYKVAGKVYRPQANPFYDMTGSASWYGPQFHGRKTANGDVFDMNDLTAAHTTLPMPSYVKVTNLDNSRWLILKINDRGPFVGNRIIDVSRRAAQLLGFEKKGVTRVRVQAVKGPRGELPQQIIAQKKKNPEPLVVAHIPHSEVKTEPLEADTARKIYIQIGAYGDQNNAQKVQRDVDHISQTKIDKVDINGQRLYRVRVGPQPTRELAEIILGRILSLGHNTARIILDY